MTAGTTNARIESAPIPRALGRPTIACCVCWFVAATIAADFGVGWVVYSASLIWCTFRVLKQPLEGLWAVFLAYAVAVIAIRLDFTSDFGAPAPQAYTYWGLSIVVVGGAMLLGSMLRRRRFVGERGGTIAPLPVNVFFVVILITTGYGYVRGNQLSVILRQGSGLVLLLFFMVVGYRIRPSLNSLLSNLGHIRTILVTYAGIYLVSELYANLAATASLPAGDFLRQRSPILFFCGLFGALDFGRHLLSSSENRFPKTWSSTLLLFAAAVLSGSRSIVASTLLTLLFFLLVRYVAHPLRTAMLLILLISSIALVNPRQVIYGLVEHEPFLRHVASRYLVAPEEDWSFLQRSSEMLAVWNGFRSSPFWGHGMGATLVWFDPYSLHNVETSFVDSGLGYLLLKTGAVGFLSFALFLGFLMRTSWVLWKITRHQLFLIMLAVLVYYAAYLPFGPSFFQFLFCFWAGILAGYLILASGVINNLRVAPVSAAA